MEPVPDGTVQEVLDWVGDDPARAEQALEAERLGAGRSTLISKLEAIASATKEDDVTEPLEAEAEEAPEFQIDYPIEVVIDASEDHVMVGHIHVRDDGVEVSADDDFIVDADYEQVETLQSAVAHQGMLLAVNGQVFAFNPQMVAVLKQMADQAVAGAVL